MKCSHCKEELGEGDEYNLMRNHVYSCRSKIGNILTNSLDAERGGY
jgi:hypothetical protein